MSRKKSVNEVAPQHTAMRLFRLHRDEDESGISGTGIVAEGVEFTHGMIALTWLRPHRVVAVYENMKAVEEVHGHGGKTRVVFLDDRKDG